MRDYRDGERRKKKVKDNRKMKGKGKVLRNSNFKNILKFLKCFFKRKYYAFLKITSSIFKIFKSIF